MKRLSLIVAPLVLLLALVASGCASTPSVSPTAPTTGATSAPSGAAPTTAGGGATAATPVKKPATKATAQAPKYGGTINLAVPFDVSTWDDATQGGPGGWDSTLTNQELTGGDWTKGPAGGYGTNTTDWGNLGIALFSLKAGYIAQSWKIDVSSDKKNATIVYEIRPGIHYALNPNSPASVKVAGRELTVDDVLSTIKEATTNSKAYIYRADPELRNVDVSKTGPMEITIKVPIRALASAEHRFGDSLRVYPTEARSMDMSDWKNHVGTGPVVLTDYVPGSSATFKKNPNFWMKDPIGPGKGNQLPYVDGVQLFIIPDPSTRLTAFRTGKIDEIDTLSWEDAAQLQKEFPQMPSADGAYYGVIPTFMRTDKKPYSDLRVRQALTMGTDFSTIKKTLNNNLGVIITFPYEYNKEYSALYVGVDDKDLPPAIKDLYTYNPTKAKQLLAQAGYPNGFTTSVLTTAADSSYYEAIASMWAKIGVKLNIDVKDAPSIMNIVNSKESYPDMVTGPGKGPVSIYYTGVSLQGVPGFANTSFINDPTINSTLPKIQALAGVDEQAAMKMARTMAQYAIEQAWAIPRPSYRTKTFWQPWLKNYDGELSVGYFNSPNWTQWAWVDQALKKSMGH